jgi:hypothetical protein
MGALFAQKPDQRTESEHRRGPHGLEGWTFSEAISDRPGETFPFMLVIARDGRVIHQISGDPFVWQWIFVDNGREVAYESGPLHFGLQCSLADIKTGRKLASYDCFHGIPANAPAWLRKLETAR